MTDMNSVVLIGRLTRDSELKYSTSGNAMCSFALAVNRSVKKGEKWVDEVSYIDCIVFGKTAESMSKYLLKGQQACIQGELRQNRWENDGHLMSKIEVIASSIQLLGGKSDKPQQQKREDLPNTPENFQGDSLDDSMIPF
jgi:single-strand DNA-binding protein